MKKLCITMAILFAAITCISPNVFAQPETQQVPEAETPSAEPVVEVKDIDILATINQKSSSPNRIWVGTFQIVWNEFMDNLVYGPINFADFNSGMARELNKQSFKKTYISENSYYTKYGVVSPDLRKTIEEGIKAKFDETSDILDLYDWTYKPDQIFIYAMLKKDFKFLNAFDKLAPGGFAKNYNSVDYFGINDKSDKKLYKNLNVMFYNSDNDFAVKLYTKNNDTVVLYRTNDDKTFDKYYADINKKAKKYNGNKKFNKDDKLRIPDINLYQQTSFKELEGHDIKGTNLRIGDTIETIDFKMDNEGVKLKSEAAIIAKMCALPIAKGRYFYFTDNFVLFLVEKNKKSPYYAMRVTDVETLNKTGRNNK